MTEIINVHRDEQTYGQTFLTFRGSTIRVATVDEQGETWLVAQDIVQSLGNTDTEGTIRKIPSQHRCLRRVPTPGGPQRMITINGEGLRWLAYRSQKALKEELVEWVNEHFPAADEGTCDEGDPYAVLDTFSLGGLVLQLVDVDSKGKPWFLAKDPCDALGYRDPEGALRKLGEKQKRTKLIRTSVGPRRMLTINEGGLYKLLLRSDKRRPRSSRTGSPTRSSQKSASRATTPSPAPRSPLPPVHSCWPFSPVSRPASLTWMSASPGWTSVSRGSSRGARCSRRSGARSRRGHSEPNSKP